MEGLDLYIRQCAITVVCRELALIVATLANGGVLPRTGVRDHATLRGIVAYRGAIEMPDGSVVKAPFGVYASVEHPGSIRVGDAARLLPEGS